MTASLAGHVSDLLTTTGLPLAALVSLTVALLTVATDPLHRRFTADTNHGDESKPQRFHSAPVPRVGGIAIMIALWVTLPFVSKSLHDLLFSLLIAALPAFLGGLGEDLFKKVGVAARLFLTMCSGIIAWSMTGYSLTSIALPGIDPLLATIPVISVIFTAFATGGVANAVNMIDGFNGLASGSVIIALAGLAAIAAATGDQPIFQLSLLIIMAIAGFMMVNYPSGKLFLGDGGAYLIGFLLAWIAVMLPARNPEVSVWAPLLAAAYPVNETLVSMARRLISRTSMGEPDRLHLHSLVKVRIVKPRFPGLPLWLRNSLVAPFCWLYAAPLAILATLYRTNTLTLQLLWLGSVVLYAIWYTWLLTRPDHDTTNG